VALAFRYLSASGIMADPFSTIVGVIDILSKIKHAYDKFKDAKDLPKAFGAIAGQIGLATSIFQDVQKATSSQVKEDKVKQTVQQCEEDATALNDIYELVVKHLHDDWFHKYKAHVATMKDGQKAKAEAIWHRIMDGCRLLAEYFNIQKMSEILAALDEIKNVPNSLNKAASADSVNNWGTVNGVMKGEFHGQTNFGGTNFAGDQNVYQGKQGKE
jgi:precorrin-6B methylase 2